MRTLLFTCFLLFIESLAVAQSPLRANSGKDYVLFIYTDEFTNGWVPLSTIKNEVAALKAELQSNYGFHVLPDLKNLSKAEATRQLESYCTLEKFKKGDQLLIYISSHGYITQNKKSGGIVFKDSKLYRDDHEELTLLPYRQLRELIEKIPCEHILLALDACYSGVFGQEFKTEPGDERWKKEPTCEEKVRESLRGTTRFYLTSVGENDRSASESTFALRFLERLREQDNDGIISCYEMYAKLVLSVKPPPHHGEFKSHIKGNDFVFIRNKVCSRDSAALKGALPCLERPKVDPARLGAPPTLIQSIEASADADLLAVVPRAEGGFAAFGYAKKISGNHASESELADGGGDEMLLLLVDRLNSIEQLKTLGRRGHERALSGLQTFDGGYALAGYTDSPGNGAMGQKDAYIVKLDALGRYLWHCRTGSNGPDQFNKIVQMDDGTLVAAGARDAHPLIVKISPKGEMTVLNEPPVQQGGSENLGTITTIAPSPFGDVLLGGQTKYGRKSSPFLMRFSIEKGERVRAINYFEGKHNDAQVVDLTWTTQGIIHLVCTELTRDKQEDALLLTAQDIDGTITFIQKPLYFGGTASDMALGLCNDVFGYTYIVGGGKSYKPTGGLGDKPFLMEINSTGQPTLMNQDPKVTEGRQFLGWQGSSESRTNAITMLPNRRLIAVGRNEKNKAVVMHFALGAETNTEPQLYFDDQALLFHDGKTLNERLDAGETAWQMLRVESSCRYVTGAYIQVEVDSGSKISCPRNLYLSDLPALSGQSVALPLTGLEGIRPGSSSNITLTLIAEGENVGRPLQIKVKH